MSRKHSWFSLLVALLVALVIPFTFLGGSILASDETEVYRVKGYNQYGNIKDSEGNVIPCVGYCLDFNNHIPESNIYRRHKLSDSSYTDDQKAILLALTYDPEDFRGFLKDLGDESVVAKNFYEYFAKNSTRGFQYVIWALCTTDYQKTTSYSSRASECGGSSSDPLNDPASLWNKVFEPSFEYLRQKASEIDTSVYDAYIYIPDNGATQPIMGQMFVVSDHDLSISKIVTNNNGNEVIYNGEDEESGYTLEITIYDTLGERPCVNENFEVTVTDDSGDEIVLTQRTDSNGVLTLQILAGQTLTISGFDSANYRVSISESDDNFGSLVTFDSIDANDDLSRNDDGSYTAYFEEGGDMEFTIVNNVDITEEEDEDEDDNDDEDADDDQDLDVPDESEDEDTDTEETTESEDEDTDTEQTTESEDEDTDTEETTESEEEDEDEPTEPSEITTPMTEPEETTAPSDTDDSSSDDKEIEETIETDLTDPTDPTDPTDSTETAESEDERDTLVLGAAVHPDNSSDETSKATTTEAAKADDSSSTSSSVPATGELFSGVSCVAAAACALAVVTLSVFVFADNKRKN